MYAAETVAVMGSERRVHARFDVALGATLGGLEGRTENLSDGGACVIHGDGRSFAAGERVELDLDIPGRGRARIDAEVRWSGGGRTGLRFLGKNAGAVAAFLVGLMTASSALASSTAVPEFDPNADVQLDMDAGGERPDEYYLLQAFQQQYDDFDRCVVQAKGKSGRQLPGDVDVSVLLNPKGKRPLGVNATLPSPVRKNQSLRECLRAAVAAAPYPAYDGVPVVVQFNFQLDPGSTWEEDDD